MPRPRKGLVPATVLSICASITTISFRQAMVDRVMSVNVAMPLTSGEVVVPESCG